MRTITHSLRPRLGSAGPAKTPTGIWEYLPKKGDLSVYSAAAIQTIEDKLDRRPRNDRATVRHNTFSMSPSTVMHFIVDPPRTPRLVELFEQAHSNPVRRLPQLTPYTKIRR